MLVEQMMQLIYLSRATQPINARELSRIQNVSVRNNQRTRISGFLMYRSGCFLQFLEGKPSKLLPLKERIAVDPRHTDFEVVYEGTQSRRLTAGWNMAVFNLDTLSPHLAVEGDPRLPLLDALLAVHHLNVEGSEALRSAVADWRQRLVAEDFRIEDAA
jgi:hypothetical protein